MRTLLIFLLCSLPLLAQTGGPLTVNSSGLVVAPINSTTFKSANGIGGGGTGTVTSVIAASPLLGGTIVTTGTISLPTNLVTLNASNPFIAGAGISFGGTWPAITINSTAAGFSPPYTPSADNITLFNNHETHPIIQIDSSGNPFIQGYSSSGTVAGDSLGFGPGGELYAQDTLLNVTVLFHNRILEDATGGTASLDWANRNLCDTSGVPLSGLIKQAGSGWVAAVAGTDYQIPISLTTTGSSGAATFNPSTGALNIPVYSGGSSGVTSILAGAGLAGNPNPIVSTGTLTLDLNHANTWTATQTGTFTGQHTGTFTGQSTGTFTGQGTGTWTGPVVGNVTGNVSGTAGSLLNGPVFSSSTGTITLTNGKTMTFPNSLTISGTDSSTLNIGAGGTLASGAYATAPASVTGIRLGAGAASADTALVVGSGLSLTTGTLTATGGGGTVTSIATSHGTAGGPITTTGTITGAGAYATTSPSTAGNTDLTSTSTTNFETVVAGAGGGSYTRSFSLLTAGAVTGDLWELYITVPASSNPVITVYNNSTGGTLLSTVTSNGVAGGTTVSYVFDGTAWQPFKKGANLIFNNGSDINNTATFRTNLGATTVGANLFTLTNPSAVTWNRVNADNTVSSRTAAQTLSDIGAQSTITFGSNVQTALGQTLNGSGALTATTSPAFVTPVLGTPTSGTLTNCTGLPVAGVTGSTEGFVLSPASGALTSSWTVAPASVSTSTGTAVSVTGGGSSNATGTGGAVSYAGGPGTGTNASGGALNLDGGTKTGSGTVGLLSLGQTGGNITRSIGIGGGGGTTVTANGFWTFGSGITTSALSLNTSNLIFTSIGKTASFKGGANAASGTVTLVSGAGSAISAVVTTSSVVVCALKTSSGTPGTYPPLPTVTTGTITFSGLATDNSTYTWVMLLGNQ